MFATLLSHQWKSFWRSATAGKGLVVQIFMGFLALYLLGVALGLGFMLRTLLSKSFPGKDPTAVLTGFLLYYYLFDMLMRFLLQELPTLSIQPYLILPVGRPTLIRFLNIRSLFQFFNLLPLLLFVPFALTATRAAYGPAASGSLVASLVGLTLFNHFLILYIKRKMIVNGWWMAGFLLVLAVLGLSDYFGLFSLSVLSSRLFMGILAHPWSWVLTALMAGWAFYNNYVFLYKNLFLEDIGIKSRRRQGADYAFLDRFGTIGEMISLDVKLILRNKRPRSLVMLSVAFLMYGFIFYKPESLAHGEWGLMLMGGFIITGIFISNYGQFLFAWQSSHFDGMMSANLQVRTYIKSKFLLLTAVSSILFLLSSFYGLLNWKLLLVQLAAYLYNIGVNTVIVAYFGTRNYKAIDIGRGATFNYQGLGAAQWIYSLVVLVIPLVIYLPFSLLIGKWAGILAIGIAGGISLLLQDFWTGLITREFLKRKYLLLQGFREK